MRQITMSVLTCACLGIAAVPSQAATALYEVDASGYVDCYLIDFGATPYPSLTSSGSSSWFAAFGQNNTKKNQLQAVTSFPGSNWVRTVFLEFTNNRGNFQGQLIDYLSGSGNVRPLTGTKVDTCTPVLP